MVLYTAKNILFLIISIARVRVLPISFVMFPILKQKLRTFRINILDVCANNFLSETWYMRANAPVVLYYVEIMTIFACTSVKKFADSVFYDSTSTTRHSLVFSPGTPEKTQPQ